MIPWITYVDALTEALRVEMRRDPTVLCLAGASSSGVQRPTDELVSEFGPSRVREHDGGPSILAAASAASSEGMRPVCEFELGALGDADAGALAAAVSSGALVLRLVCGSAAGGVSARGWETLLPEIPELKVVSPATAADAKGLLISAIRHPDPVCFVESSDLYSSVVDGVPEGEHVVPLGEARLVRQGTEIVVLAHGAAAVAAERAAKQMPGEVGVIDLRSLRPLDRDAIVASAKETGKVLIVEQPGTATGLAASLVELIYEELPQYLDAPVKDLGITVTEAGSNGQWTQSVTEACSELVAF